MLANESIRDWLSGLNTYIYVVSIDVVRTTPVLHKRKNDPRMVICKKIQ